MKLKLEVYYGKNKPGDVVDVAKSEAEILLDARQATVVEESEPKVEDKKPQGKAGGGRES